MRKEIEKIYKSVFDKIYNNESIKQLSRRNTQSIFQKVALLNRSKAYENLTKRVAKELAKIGVNADRSRNRRNFEYAKKLRHVALTKSWKDYQLDIFKKAALKNFEMIKSIPNDVLKIMSYKYADKLIDEVVKGNISRGSFRRELEKHGAKNARLIARTETAKIQTAIAENRATELKSPAYFWKSSNDNRTRKSHRNMNGVIVFWRQGMEKPLLDKMYGNAGEFPNCRCGMNLIFDEDDLTKSTYRVYDYRHHEIITMSRKDVIAALKRGGL